MAGAESNNDMFAGTSLPGVRDIEAGTSSGHVSDIERQFTPIEAPLERIPDRRSTRGHVDDIDQWAGSLARMLEDVPRYMCTPGHPGRISRIPENLREAAVKSYEPYILSFGPYHHGKPNLKRRELKKQVILKCFLEQNPELTLRNCLTEIMCMESAARSFYSDVNMESEKFVHMLLLDCVFILSKFCGIPGSPDRNRMNTGTRSPMVIEDANERSRQMNEGEEVRDDNENMQLIARTEISDADVAENYVDPPALFWTLFVHDLFLLENQLPFFVLEKIYELAYGGSKTQFMNIMKYHIGNLLTVYTNLDSEMVASPYEEVHHLLHLCHMFFRPMLQQESITLETSEASQIFRLGSAIQLYEAGVRFEARCNPTRHSLLDITFGSDGKIVMPCLYVDDNLDSLLRNLISLEQMKYPSLGLDVSAYAVLLLHLVTTPQDVKLLRRKGIIEHHLASDKEMMYLINRLSVGLAFDYAEDRYGLKPVFQELKRYTERKVPRWRAWLKHRYFSNPWTVISLVAASLLLLLSGLQTFYSIYSYYR